MGWFEYFTLDKLKIYNVMIKELSRHVEVIKDNKITSTLLGKHIKITCLSIVVVTQFLDEGMKLMSGYERTMNYL